MHRRSITTFDYFSSSPSSFRKLVPTLEEFQTEILDLHFTRKAIDPNCQIQILGGGIVFTRWNVGLEFGTISGAYWRIRYHRILCFFLSFCDIFVVSAVQFASSEITAYRLRMRNMYVSVHINLNIEHQEHMTFPSVMAMMVSLWKMVTFEINSLS